MMYLKKKKKNINHEPILKVQVSVFLRMVLKSPFNIRSWPYRTYNTQFSRVEAFNFPFNHAFLLLKWVFLTFRGETLHFFSKCQNTTGIKWYLFNLLKVLLTAPIPFFIRTLNLQTQFLSFSSVFWSALTADFDIFLKPDFKNKIISLKGSRCIKL